jgi:adenylate cyclase
MTLDPTHIPSYARLADVYIALGRYDDAKTWLDKGQEIAPDTRRQTDGYGVVYALSGRRAEAEAIVRELAARAGSSDQVAYSLAMVQTALGQHDQAIEWLNRGYEAHSATMWLVNCELKFDALRGDPRFQELLRRMHFPS